MYTGSMNFRSAGSPVIPMRTIINIQKGRGLGNGLTTTLDGKLEHRTERSHTDKQASVPETRSSFKDLI